jgi:murein DD-endopeptidase MepM/ murein hydrolase activator NlpD
MKKLVIIALSALALAGCARSGPPAPVDLRGVGAGETRPGMGAPTTTASRNPASTTGNYSPPPGYGSGGGNGGIQTENLGEPNDPYAQAAQQQASFPPPQSMDAGQPVPPAMGGVMPAPAAGLPAADMSSMGSGDYGWPLRGRILSEYGQKPGGTANDGLNIAASQGTAVYASKDGTVAYAGNELRSFGNMVLVRHTGGYFTVYAHLDQINVSKGQTITKGQPVGTVGQSGGVSEPQLHFEVRQGSNPLDPRKFLGS